MATLTESAFYARKIIHWGIIGIICFIFLRIGFTYIVDTIRRTFPPPTLVPNNAFGKLPSVAFPQAASPSGELTYTLQTISGTVPTASEAARVYFMPKNRANLLSISKAQSFVDRIRFTAPPRRITDTLYRWTDTNNPLRSIDLDIVSYHFIYTYNYTHDLSLFAERQIPSPQQAKNESIAFLQSLGLGTLDLDTLNPKITYLKLTGDRLVPATSQSVADAVQIDLFRRKYDATKVVSNDLNTGVASILLSGSRQAERRILSVTYRFWPIDIKTAAIYKLKSSSEAWEELKSGQAYFASLPPQEKNIKITNIYLAYYDSIGPQLFLQPVFVFEGENNFAAYIPAIAPPWVQ